MGKTLLTPKQSHFLELVAKEPNIVANYYFTGGTALAEFHLQHRKSEDIDLFSENEEVNPVIVEAFLKKISPKIGVSKIKKNQMLGLVSYKLAYSDREELKVDFNYYPFLRISKGKKYKTLDVDSLPDIAANKMHTIFMKPRSRDFIDLFFIFKSAKYDLNRVILDAKAKFDWHIDPIGLSSQFLKVKELGDLTTMLVPFHRGEMEEFFLQKAKELKKDIFT
ncbi:MAG: Uncharacterized protein G01um101416_142 [Microgenomates group bacterium Gr01-1014_16]|nr:MAG: Uncharacterized protein G01um101416_142 [Microgenomates group bacterium Gr01-1014_16]